MADPEGPADLLANEPKRLLTRPVLAGLIAAAVLVVALLWPHGDATAPDRALPAPIAGAPVADPATVPDRITQVSYVDAVTGFAVEGLCSIATTGEPCAQRLLATSDAGRHWPSRGRIPQPDGDARLVVSSATELTWLNPLVLTEAWRSSDGGASWVRRPVVDGLPAPAPAGPVTWTFIGCAGTCRTTTPSWIDPLPLVVHPLPEAPVLPAAQHFTQVSSSGNGSILLSGATGPASGLIATSIDGGSTWQQSSLTTDASIVATQLIAEPGGGYVLATAVDPAAGGSTATRLYRTDDAGGRWERITVDEPLSRWEITGPGGAPSDGTELLASDASGRLFRSSASGSVWSQLLGSPRLVEIAASPGVLWGRVVRVGTVDVSLDGGGSWVEVTPPPH